jgi:hypothetical protein
MAMDSDARSAAGRIILKWILKVIWCQSGDQWRVSVNVVMSLRAPQSAENSPTF